ncbi:MAG: hypothetical protein KJZ86_02600 [Caldilineaceae bacterium]|nr:hypothetical protein [Caldilineaceae bacterium]HRJ43461.1 hypothetical protein [Caldilineaceae bacterium]
MKRHFCTYFDHNYLPRGLALYRSLQAQCPDFTLWVLCLDDEAHALLSRLALPGVEAIALADFEAGDDELLRAKAGRSLIEYYFTCTPSLPLYIFARWPDVDQLTYLDADLYFFASPEALFAEIGDASIALISHRFPPNAQAQADQFGIYNVGWLTFRHDENGLACLRRWRGQTIAWCSDTTANGQFGDQKYLDDWPESFENVHIIQHTGANAGPWNLTTYPITRRDGQVWIGDDPLIFFHFQSLKRVRPWFWNPRYPEYIRSASAVVRRDIYAPYIRELLAADAQVAALSSASAAGDVRTSRTAGPATSAGLPLLRGWRLLEGTLRGRYIYWFGNRAL